ncbi:MAG: amidase domain-containing protein [Firmicutes bacterium]|nr:amidase domain-containing protein [Bacillota bacterium]
MQNLTYNRAQAAAYAQRWALERNPKYFNFDGLGGDCTNFVSQCLYAGAGVMNYAKDLGWYYHAPHDRAAAWSGVEYLYRFLTLNRLKGPYAKELPLSAAETGDIIQLNFDGLSYTHSLFVVSVQQNPNAENILIASHTDDSLNRPLNTYYYNHCRLLHIEGVR